MRILYGLGLMTHPVLLLTSINVVFSLKLNAF